MSNEILCDVIRTLQNNTCIQEGGASGVAIPDNTIQGAAIWLEKLIFKFKNMFCAQQILKY